jgi:hypothetical protein
VIVPLDTSNPGPLEDYDWRIGPAEPTVVKLPTLGEPVIAPLPMEVRRSADDGAVKRTLIATGIVVGALIFLHYLYLLFRGPVIIEKEIEVPVAKKVASPAPASAPQPPAQNPELFKALTEGVVDSPVVKQVTNTATRESLAKSDATPPATTQGLATIHPRVRKHVDVIDDEAIEKSIRRGAEFLIAQYPSKRLKGADAYDADTFAGLNALGVYAMIVAGDMIHDPRLDVRGDFMKGLIERMKETPMDGNRATYSRSIRAAALAVHDRPEDRATLEGDAKWLMRTAVQGAYTYTTPPNGTTRAAQFNWDNSNSQYGALGVWAAEAAGMDVPAQYWQDVEAHWADCQVHSGGWSYQRGGNATLAMTAAGVNMLYVAADQLGYDRTQLKARTGVAEVLERGLEWLDEGKNAVELRGGHRGYTLYSLERVGLSSGLKFFGDNDWYRVLAEQTVREQAKDGSWSGADPVPAETAFSILFLCRGRYPIFMSKLRYEVNWEGHSRDLQNLTKFVSQQLERPVNWQVADLDRTWRDWTDSPVLMIEGAEAPKLEQKDIENLRNYAEAGGMIFTQAINGAPAFNDWAKDLAGNLFPGREFKPLPADHLAYRSVFKMEKPPELLGVSNGSRSLMIHSSSDVSGKWVRRVTGASRAAEELGMNLFAYAAGRRDFRNRIQSPVVAADEEIPAQTLVVGRVKYEGNWDPEPGAWRREEKLFQRDTGIGLDVQELNAFGIVESKPVVAHSAANDVIALTDAECKSLKEYVEGGGVLLIEACGGAPAVATALHETALPRILGAAPLAPIDAKHPLLAGGMPGMVDVSKVKINDEATERFGSDAPMIQIAKAGKGYVLFSAMDLTTGMLDCRVMGVAGYKADWVSGFMNNLLLWAAEQRQ